MNYPKFSLKGRVALITGGSRGIGEAAAILLAKAGADIVVTSRNQADLDLVSKKLEAEGVRALAVSAHVGKIDQIQNLIDRVMEKFGRIDILVNNAGTSFNSPSLEITEKAWDSVMNLNLKGLFFLSQAAGKIMKETGGGKIINIASVAGIRVQDATPHYSISKAAVIMATKVLAKEWAEYNIRVNCIAPGSIETKLFEAIFDVLPEEERDKVKNEVLNVVPMKRAGMPDEIADAILFLASDASSYITGETITIDGGLLL